VVVTTLQRVGSPDEAGVHLLITTRGGKQYDFAVSLPVGDELKHNLSQGLAEAAAQYARKHPAK
jgi:hypothetical protein